MIDELAVAAAHELRGTITSDLDAGLLELYAGRRHRRRNFAAAAAAAAVAIALGIGWWGGRSMTRDAPVSPPNPGPTHGVGRTQTCIAPVHCLGPATYRFALTRPVTWHIPGGFHVSSGDPTPWMVQAKAQREQQGGGPYQYATVAGITVLEGVRAASADGQAAASQVADTPQAFVSWLAAQPYLHASPITTTRIYGRPAWHVRVTLADLGGNGPTALCNDTVACYPLTVTPDQRVNGIWGSMVADLTAFRLPRAGTTLVWSWAFSHDQGALARNDGAVRGLTWPTG
jgi:hypothetical protein